MTCQKAFLTLSACLCLSVAARGQWKSLVQDIVAADAAVRINRLVLTTDTAALLRQSPAMMEGFLAAMKTAATTLKDDELADYVAFFGQLSPLYYEEDGHKRIACYQAVLEKYRQRGEQRFQASCLHYIGQEHFLLGNYTEAFTHILESQALLRQIGFLHIPEIGKYLHDLALNYYYFRDYSKVREVMLEALHYPPFSANLDIQRYNTLALAYQHLDQADSAEYYFEETIARAQHYQDATWVALGSGNLAGILKARGQYRDALPLLMLDFTYNRHNVAYPEMARNAALSIALIWLAFDRPDSAWHYLRESESIQLVETSQNRFGRQHRDEEFLRSYYDVRRQYHAQLGQHALAYRYLDSLIAVASVLDGRYNAMVTELAERRMQIQQQLAQIDLGKQQQRTSSARLFAALAVALLLAVGLGMLYLLLRTKAARQRMLSELTQQQLLADQERNEEAFRQARIELGHQLALLDEKNRLVSQLESELEALRKRHATPQDVLQDAVEMLAEARLLTGKDWSSFRRKFNAVFDDSLDRLKADCPDITPSEERIYALNQLGVDTKTMAGMLGISPESVRKARYRLKKRLELVN